MWNKSLFLAASLVVATASCSSSSPAPAPAASTEDAGTAVAGYPEGPYGVAIGSVLADREMRGYLRFDTTGLANTAPNGVQSPLKFSDIRALAMTPPEGGGEPTVKYAVIHLTAYWCPICKATIEELVAQYPKYASKATFVDILIEGVDPSTPTTNPQLDAWIKAEKVPFTTMQDPDGSFGIKKALGAKDTTYLVELASMKILYKGAYDTALTKLKAL